jgi:hypothetical protein
MRRLGGACQTAVLRLAKALRTRLLKGWELVHRIAFQTQNKLVKSRLPEPEIR